MRILPVVLCAALAAACGSSSPTSPSSLPGTIVSLTVTSANGYLYLGATETFGTLATLSNGATQTVTGATWSADAPQVATVDAATGKVTSAGAGFVTISAVYQGTQGSKRVQIVPNYGGTWVGTYQVDSCVDSGDFVALALCPQFQSATPQSALGIQQTGGTTINGQTALGSLVGSITPSTIAADGSLAFTATFQSGTTTIAEQWRLTLGASGSVTGTLVQTWSDTTLAGQVVLSCTLNPMTKSSSGSVSRLGASAPRTLAEAVKALLGGP